MSSKRQPISTVPTNIITGFLGVGKTSAILQLMRNKPENERWAVLVNEFGEIGIDGALLQGQHQQQGVYIREVPGGCMCCAAGLPMQIALNQLLSESTPDRLLIEPTGLGHPKEVLQVLSSKYYQQVLSLNKTLTLVDARHLADSRYTSHDTFNQQIAIADRVIGNKLDLYQADDKQALINYVAQHGRKGAQVQFSEHGRIDLASLQGATASNYAADEHHHHGHKKALASELPIPESGYLKASNQGEGFNSIGWRFAPTKVFDRKKLRALLLSLKVERIKAVFITSSGVFGYNYTSDGLSEAELDDCQESRIEIIANQLDENLEDQLLACLSH
ncbi:GTP-binding protein [Agarivorans sp. TSD2052]|uniref:CobW family GTP-binding protein n=1 Tax=Agarivorans sp. TSD2052 TaxID=2937286 RepID=UPI00200C9BA4|nr:GTP-binding protein [Agarivorans sp. TSD2052]UPW19860.1 GTP-binding protein [Agarivorans sp. TSD2052]